MGYLWNSYMRERDKQLKAASKKRAEKAAAAHLRRLIAGVRCPVCWQEAYVAKYFTQPSKVPANAGVRLRDLPRGTPVPPTVLCTCPEGHQYQVQNGQLLPPSVPPRRVRG
jgi:hypothetical protein